MQNHLTLSQLQKLVKATLDEAFALPVWVSAEIAEIKINYSGHCYLELVEKGGDNGVPLSQARAVIWRTAYARIAGYFEAETGQRLAAGIRILARVMISYHELYGFSLNILDIDPTFTLGDMERQRQITIERLQREGVWDINRENPLPQVVQRIAIVSSRQAAGYQDFCKELGKSPYAFSLTLFDAFMQGAGAEDSIVAALDAVADRMDDFDAVVLIRGGGSASDLNCFNAYRLCAHIAQFPLPILTGIGHDKDTSVADMVAHTALKTPTAVAGWLVERMTGVEGWLDTAALQLRDASAGIFRRHELRLAELGSEIAHQSALLLLRRNEQLSRWSDELSAAVGELLRREIPDGGWTLTGGEPDVDITAMTLQALAKYRDWQDVEDAVQRGIAALSALQEPNGAYLSWDEENSESVCQVIVALTELGISLDDERFVKNGQTLPQVLERFACEDGSYRHSLNGGSDEMATEQAFYALAAIHRAETGETTLYDMTDVMQ